MLMSSPPAPNIQYRITSDQYLPSATNTFIHLESKVSHHVFLDGEINYRLYKFSKILRLNKKMIIWFSSQQQWMA